LLWLSRYRSWSWVQVWQWHLAMPTTCVVAARSPLLHWHWRRLPPRARARKTAPGAPGPATGAAYVMGHVTGRARVTEYALARATEAARAPATAPGRATAMATAAWQQQALAAGPMRAAAATERTVAAVSRVDSHQPPLLPRPEMALPHEAPSHAGMRQGRKGPAASNMQIRRNQSECFIPSS
jgi:hypothetical protein